MKIRVEKRYIEYESVRPPISHISGIRCRLRRPCDLRASPSLRVPASHDAARRALRYWAARARTRRGAVRTCSEATSPADCSRLDWTGLPAGSVVSPRPVGQPLQPLAAGLGRLGACPRWETICRNDIDVAGMSLSAPLLRRFRQNGGAEIDISSTSTSFRHRFDESFLTGPI